MSDVQLEAISRILISLHQQLEISAFLAKHSWAAPGCATSWKNWEEELGNFYLWCFHWSLSGKAGLYLTCLVSTAGFTKVSKST